MLRPLGRNLTGGNGLAQIFRISTIGTAAPGATGGAIKT